MQIDNLDWEMLGAIAGIVALIITLISQWRGHRWLIIIMIARMIVLALIVALFAALGSLVGTGLNGMLVKLCSFIGSIRYFSRIVGETEKWLIAQRIYFNLIGGLIGSFWGLGVGWSRSKKLAEALRSPYEYQLGKKSRSQARIDAALTLEDSGRVEAAIEGWLALARDERAYPEARLEAAQALGRLRQAETVTQQYRFCELRPVNKALERTVNRFQSFFRPFAGLIDRFRLQSVLLRAMTQTQLDVACDWDANTEVRLEAARALVRSKQTEAATRAWLVLARSEYIDPEVRLDAARTLLDLGDDELGKRAFSKLARNRKTDVSIRLRAAEALQELGEEELATNLLLALARDNE